MRLDLQATPEEVMRAVEAVQEFGRREAGENVLCLTKKLDQVLGKPQSAAETKTKHQQFNQRTPFICHLKSNS